MSPAVSWLVLGVLIALVLGLVLLVDSRWSGHPSDPEDLLLRCSQCDRAVSESDMLTFYRSGVGQQFCSVGCALGRRES